MADYPQVGPPGPPGPKGDSGSAGGSVFTFDQSVPLSTWVIAHNIGRNPVSVVVIDTAGTVILGEVHFDSVNQATLLFSAPFAGKAYFS